MGYRSLEAGSFARPGVNASRFTGAVCRNITSLCSRRNTLRLRCNCSGWRVLTVRRCKLWVERRYRCPAPCFCSDPVNQGEILTPILSTITVRRSPVRCP